MYIIYFSCNADILYYVHKHKCAGFITLLLFVLQSSSPKQLIIVIKKCFIYFN